MTTMDIHESRTAISDARLDRIEARLDALLAHAEQRDAELEPLRDLAAEIGVLSGPAMATVTDHVAAWEASGYLGFARSGARVVDRIMTSFGEEDVEALGDNVVLMLETLRDLTQPEILRLLRQTAGSVGHLEVPPGTEPPSTFALLRQLRDPEVRRGLGRMLDLLKNIGADEL
ncbi:MAG: DUF1641 domain-containing protein [Actinobacteria bacterium]|nr:DUF1641 domain-containing protein [Actinomycetota bacterium]